MSALRIGRLDPSHRDAAASVYARAFADAADGSRKISAALSPPPGTLVSVFGAFAGKELAGILICNGTGARKTYAIDIVAVDPAHRRQGVAHALMERAERHISEEWMKGRGGRIRLVDATKTGSLSYEKMGYRQECPDRPEFMFTLVKKIA